MSNYQFPVGLLGITVFYWGWSLNIWPIGLAMALLLEFSHWSPWRLQLRDRDFMRIADLTAVAFAITGFTLLLYNLYESLFLLAEWLPMIMYLLIGAQLYNDKQETPLKALIASLRRRKPVNPDEKEKTVDLRLPYFFITLIATSIAAPKSDTFYIITCLLLLRVLWQLRERHSHPALWLMMTGSAFASGFVLLTGISQLQGMVQEITTNWFQADWSQRNVQRNSTAMGQIGRLKLSEQILMRINNSYGSELLLQQASYNRFSGITWHVTDQQYQQVNKHAITHQYPLTEQQPEKGGELIVATELQQGEGVLALPLGSYAIENRRKAKLFVNEFGTTRIEQDDTSLDFRVRYRRDLQRMSAPTSFDLEVPQTYHKLLKNIVDQLQLRQLSPKTAAAKLEEFFHLNFQYSLVQDDMGLVLNPLSAFLTDVRRGHCEYFATAGALILREAGIATRYATGYLMSEFDPDDNRFIVRSRHAHAWTLAFIDNQWVELDYTPPSWVALESEAAPWWLGIYDVASNGKYSFYKWWNAKPRSPENYALVVFLLLGLFFVLRKFRAEHFRFHWQKITNTRQVQPLHRQESPFCKIMQHLENTKLARRQNETIRHWIRKIPDLDREQRMALELLVEKHYQYRFSGASKNLAFKESFVTEVDSWIQKHVS